MNLLAPSAGLWLFGCSAVYFVIGMVDIFLLKTDWFPWIQLAWLCLIALPLVCNPLARWLNMKENNMFDWFGKKETSNVVPFPASQDNNPYIPPPAEPEKPVTTYYRLGITNNGRVSFQMGYSEITMNAGGINNMIEQLEVFRDQILHYEDNGPEDDPNGGEPVPVPEKKTA
jgi:hypothetical protein